MMNIGNYMDLVAWYSTTDLSFNVADHPFLWIALPVLAIAAYNWYSAK